jgi:hypothetical protein
MCILDKFFIYLKKVYEYNRIKGELRSFVWRMVLKTKEERIDLTKDFTLGGIQINIISSIPQTGGVQNTPIEYKPDCV